MLYVASHLAGLLILAILCWLAGYALDRLLAGDFSGDLRFLRRLCLGLGFWTAIAFVLAAVGLLRPGVLGFAALAVVATAIMLRRRPPAGAPAAGAPTFPPARSWSLLAVFAALLAPLLSLALTPTVSWDASAYHLTVPRLYLEHGGFREVPFNVYSYWPLNVELLFALALAAGDHVLAKLLHFAFGLATLYALFAGCRTFHRRASGPLAAIFFLANGVVASELRVAYVDLAHAFFLLAGILFMIEALERDRRALWLSGLCCGLAAGVKLTGIAGAAIVGALYLPRLVRRDPAEIRRFLSRFAAPVLGLWAPWVARTWLLTGNPAYPFFHRWLGGPDWSPRLTDQLQAWQSWIGMGREPIDYLLLPLRVILAGGRGYERFDGSLGVFWIVLVPLVLLYAPRSALIRRCLAVSGLYFVFWSLTSQQMRLLIPALPPLAIAAAAALVELLDRLPRRWRSATRGLAFAAAATFFVASQGSVLAAGYRTSRVYPRAEGDLLASARHPVWGFVEEELPPDARLLLLNTNQGYDCRREYLADSFFEASQIADWLAPAADLAELRSLLRERGVSHVLLEHQLRGAVYPPPLEALLRDPAEAVPVYRSEDGRYSVLELGGREAKP